MENVTHHKEDDRSIKTNPALKGNSRAFSCCDCFLPVQATA